MIERLLHYSNHLQTTLRVKLMVTFVICVILSFFTAVSVDRIFKEFRKTPFTSYVSSKEQVQNQLLALERQLDEGPEPAVFSSAMNAAAKQGGVEAYLTDTFGNIVLHSEGAAQQRLNIYEALYTAKAAMKEPQPGLPYMLISPVRYRGEEAFLIVNGPLLPEQGYMYKNSSVVNFILVTTLFILYFYLFTFRKMRQIRQMNNSLSRIAEGELSVRLAEKSRDELGLVSANINAMAQRLQETQERERKLEKSRMELITSVSHDLRTPLTSIIGYLTILKDQNISEEADRKRYILNAYSKTEQLRKLIDDLFQYTKLTGIGVRLNKTKIDLISLLEQMLNEFEPLAQLQDVAIHKEWQVEPLPALADSELMARALDNLLMNALKFSVKPGEIKVTAGMDYHGAYLCIENKGPPISKEQEERLFDRFYKADASRNESLPPGSGLGLAITRNIIELHGGRVWLTHEAGRYRFWVTLPFQIETFQV